ncbi:MAG: SMP-30/gluconolactonase/LRE family protein [Planctomycetota bacterium]|nr:SMP-30/gluconolactonase/LRE family protein [Planctomycetota bacterium]
MRRSGWLLPIPALVLWLMAALWPALAGAVELLSSPTGTDAASVSVEMRPAAVLLLDTGAWALAVAVGAMLIGWAPGRLLGRALHGRGFIPLAALMLLPICLPAYVVFYTWWQAFPPGSAVFDFAESLNTIASGAGRVWSTAFDRPPPPLFGDFSGIVVLRRGVLLLGLLCWSWPLVAWCVAGSVATIPAQHEEMLLLDGAGPAARLLDRLRTDRRGLLIGGLLVFLAAFNNTTCFDLAQIFTFGNELRAKDSMGASVGQVLSAALPAVALAAIGAGLIWLLLSGRPHRAPTRTGRSALSTRLGGALIWILSVALPIALLSRNLGGWSEVEQFLDLYGRGLAGTIILAAISGGLGVLIAVGLAAAWSDHRRWVRAAAHVQAAGWVLLAVVPGTIVGVCLEAAYNVPLVVWPPADAALAGVIYRSEAIIVLGHLARFGFVAALLGRWIAVREPRALRDLRRQDGAETLTGLIGAVWPRLLAAAVASLAIVFVLSMSEIPVTARVHPAGSDPLAMALLNAMHYQRPLTVIIASLALLGVALVAAVLTALVWAPLRGRRSPRIALGVLLLLIPAGLVLAGCGGDGAGDPSPLRTRLIFGSTGDALGQFAYPRCLAVDRGNDLIYIIDKTARVQRFSLDGEAQFQWRMPAMEAGKPTGVSVAPDGRVFVADTHYYRVIAYTPDGEEVLRFGSYGEGPGQFIYPTDIAFGPAGRLYVAEYGGNDRIQVFTAEGEYLFEFGSFGESEGQFNRPQAIAFNADLTELYIADACNHRIVVTAPDGRWRRRFGAPGTGAGELHYPYGLTLLEDGSLLVAEFGNNRIQRFSPDGRSRGLFGRLGAGEGELRYPWAVDTADGTVFILDSGNNRVQTIRTP